MKDFQAPISPRFIENSKLPALVLAFLILNAPWFTACTLFVDADGMTGHPCDEFDICLPGYSCVGGLCVEDPGSGALICDPACKGQEKCDHRRGECVDRCEASVCPTGWGCNTGGECRPIETGIGSPCSNDADCAGAIPGCSVDSQSPSDLRCACFVPANARRGVCLAIPSFSEGCNLCDDADCLEVSFSIMGSRPICVPGGFRVCSEGQPHCVDSEYSGLCSVLAWPEDPGLYLPGEQSVERAPLGVMAVCIAKRESSSLEVGEVCRSGNADECSTGICVSSGAEHICSYPCGGDSACRGVGEDRCVVSPLDTFYSGKRIFDLIRLCGTSPSLGRTCSGAGLDPLCGTDAPICREDRQGRRICSRPCRDDEDCPSSQGFECDFETSFCRSLVN